MVAALADKPHKGETANFRFQKALQRIGYRESHY
jgi:hypothetical protein